MDIDSTLTLTLSLQGQGNARNAGRGCDVDKYSENEGAGQTPRNSAQSTNGRAYNGHTRGNTINITLKTTIVNGSPTLRKSRGV